MKKSLIIVDMQVMPFIWKDYGGKTIFNEELLIKNTKKLIEKARKANAPIYYMMYTEPEGSPRSENQPLWQVHPEIAPCTEDQLIVKYHADSFYNTALDKNLKANQIDSIVLCGIQTEFCLDTTVRSAFSHGYKVTLASDCHSTYDSDSLTATQIITHHNTILEQFADRIPADNIVF